MSLSKLALLLKTKASTPRLLLVLAMLFSLIQQSHGAAGIVQQDVPYVETFAENCTQVLALYRPWGTCCSLSDVVGVPGVQCQITYAGNNTYCNLRTPNYQCIPEQGCLPEYNVLYIMVPDYECPPSIYPVPLTQPTTNTSTNSTNTTNNNTDDTAEKSKKSKKDKGHNRLRGLLHLHGGN